jgi:hypothetical protein
MGSARSITLLPLLALAAIACSDVPTDETPRGTVRLFLAAMERSEHDEEALREAYALLSAPTRGDLQERAHLATSFGADQLEPWEMLVRGGFRQTFTPAKGAAGMREQIDGDEATVVVTNEAGDRRAEVPLVRESGRWRLVLALPPARE